LVEAAISVVARCRCRDVVALAICDMLSSSLCVRSHHCRHLFHAGTGSSSSPCAQRRRRGCRHLFRAGKGSLSSPCAWRQCWRRRHLCHTHGDGVVIIIINDVLAWGHLFVMRTEMTMSSSSSPWHWPWLWHRRRHFRCAGTKLLLLLSSPCHWPWGRRRRPLCRGTGHGRHVIIINAAAAGGGGRCHCVGGPSWLSSSCWWSMTWMVVVAIIVIVVLPWHQPSASCRCHCHHLCLVVVAAGDIETDGHSGRGSKMAAGIETDGSGIVEMNRWCWLVTSKWMVVVAHRGSKMGWC